MNHPRYTPADLRALNPVEFLQAMGDFVLRQKAYMDSGIISPKLALQCQDTIKKHGLQHEFARTLAQEVFGEEKGDELLWRMATRDALEVFEAAVLTIQDHGSVLA